MKDSFDKLSYDELITKRDQLRKDYLDLRMSKVLGHVDNPLAVRTTRRKIARLNTLINEHALGIRKVN